MTSTFEQISNRIKVVALLAALGLPYFLTVAGNISQDTQLEVIQVPGHMKFCKNDEQCTYVETTCSDCCGYVGINTDYENIFYERELRPACKEYSGPVCECISDRTTPVCKQGVCALKKNKSSKEKQTKSPKD